MECTHSLLFVFFWFVLKPRRVPFDIVNLTFVSLSSCRLRPVPAPRRSLVAGPGQVKSSLALIIGKKNKDRSVYLLFSLSFEKKKKTDALRFEFANA